MWLVQELCITPFRGGGEPTAGHISRRKRFEDLSFLSFRIQASVLPFDLLRMLLSRQTSQGNNRKVKGRFDQEGKAKILYYDCLPPYLTGDPDIKKQLGLYYRFWGVFVGDGKFVKVLYHPILTVGVLLLRVLVGLSFITRK